MTKILVLCDDAWHPANVPQEGLSILSQAGFDFDWIENTRDWPTEQMMDYPAVILTKSNNVSSTDRTGWMTDAVQNAFFEYVQNGNGLLVIHSGTAEYDDKLLLRSLLGGVFSHHPEQCPVTVTPHAGHPLAVGISAFTLRDEHYFMALDDAQADIFMTTTSLYGEQPGAWRRLNGQGRVVVLTPGHNLEVWLHPSFQAFLLNSLRWCCKLIF